MEIATPALRVRNDEVLFINTNLNLVPFKPDNLFIDASESTNRKLLQAA